LVFGTVPAVTTSIRCTIMQTPARDEVEVLRDVRITIAESGLIVSIESGDSGVHADVVLPSTTVVIPGLVDTHIHAPQWPQLGTGLDLSLEKWLFENTFPLESKLTDPAFAGEVWPDMVATLLAHGTTTAVYYATVSVETTTMLAEACAAAGQRAFVGRVAMDHPDGTPTWYRDADAQAGIAASTDSLRAIQALGSDLVEPMITPRFAPACTDELLRGLGELAATSGVRVQTHCSESDWEHGYALERFAMSDTEALDGFGLLRDHTVLAHGDHLGDSDLAKLAATGAGVAHCPLSNAYFANAVFPARGALDAGVRVGLGTDVAGGAQPGLLSQCADAVTMSRLLDEGVDAGLAPDERGVSGSRISITDAFWMATVGGAELLGIDAGLLAPGRHFDAVAVDTARPGSPLRIWDGVDDDERSFEKIVRLATPADITDVWVAGRRVSGNQGAS
jgi:guanine deaminase